MPARFWGVTHAPLVYGTKAAPPVCPPLTNAQDVAPVAGLLTAKLVPAVITAGRAEAPAVMVNAGNGVIARLEPAGQEEMKPAASVNTARMPRGVSNADGMAAALEAVRMNV